MKHITRKVRTLQALVDSSSKISDLGMKGSILDDLEEIRRCLALQPDRRRRLLHTLHAARALEGAIRQVMAHHSISVPPNRRTLGGYLWALANATPSRIPFRMRSECQHYVVRF